MRREGLRTKNNWENNNPPYDIERYRKHYFYSDFDDLKAKFENMKAESNQTDFIPHHVALRVKETIVFSVKLDSGAPGIGDDRQTRDLIYQDDDSYDYESVPILRDFKIEQLRKIV